MTDYVTASFWLIVSWLALITLIKIGCLLSKGFREYVHSDDFMDFGGSAIVGRLKQRKKQRRKLR